MLALLLNGFLTIKEKSLNVFASHVNCDMVFMKEHEGAHRCVFASITVKAPVREVWNVLTAYENLPE